MERLLDLRDLEAFVAVSEEGSFTAAAKRLGTNQPAISARIAALEASLSVRLFDRGARQSNLTPVGRAVLPRVRTVLRDADQVFACIDDFFGDPRGVLDVGASSVPGSYLIPRHLAELHRRLPRVHVRLVVQDTEQTLAALREDRIELGVVGRPVTDDELDAVEIAVDRVVLVAEPRLAEHHPISDLQDLAGVPVILREAGSATRATALAALEDAGFDPRRLERIVEIRGNEAARQAVLNGAGAAFLSHLVVERELREGSLVELRCFPGAERPLVAVTRRGRTLSPGAHLLAGLLRGEGER